MKEQYVVICGPQDETDVCYGPFDSFEAAVIWSQNNDAGLNSIYKVQSPAVQ